MALPVNAKIELLDKLTDDFVHSVKTGVVPATRTYQISVSEDTRVRQSAREAALESIIPCMISKLASDVGQNQITKVAFDTRRVDQEGTRNPRKNLQYWHRSDQFIEEEDEKKLKTFAKLAKVLTKMKTELGTSPEWFESYSRQLYDNVSRILRVKEADMDIFRPQLSYLEQLIFARYRLSMENLEKLSSEEIQDKILAKDEELIGRSAYLKETRGEDENVNSIRIKDANGQPLTQDSIIQAIFGSGSLRKDGEKTVERTITITLRDNVIEKEAQPKKASVVEIDEDSND
jgi:hypothetical protein